MSRVAALGSLGIIARIEMTSTHQQAGDFRTQHVTGVRFAGGAVLLMLAIYLLGYVVLCSQDYFDLVRLPWSSHTSDWLYQIYRPLEWLRHLW